MSIIKFITPFVSFFAIAVQAQQLTLDAATLSRLGVVFQQVAAPTASDGTRIAATVIPSPLEANAVHALYDGLLAAWQVKAGQQVVAGEVLGELHSPAFAQLQQQWMSASAQSSLMQNALVRDKSLLTDGIIAEQRLQTTEQNARAAKFELQALTRQLELSGFTSKEVDALQTGNIKPGVYLVKAPIAGTVTHLPFVVGSTVAQHDTLVMLANKQLWVSAELPARLQAYLQIGQSLTLADGNNSLVLQQIDQSLDSQTQTFGVLAEFTAATNLLPGQIVSLVVPPLVAGVVVPAEAVVRNGSERLVFVRNGAGVEAKMVELTPLGSDYLVTQGLAPKAEIAIRGTAILKGIMLGLGGE